MSRSGYVDDFDLDPWNLIRWRGAVQSAIRGKRGQHLLQEMLVALDAMPKKALAAESLVTEEGERCALGALAEKRGLPVADLDPEDPEAVAKAFNSAPALVREIVFQNDEGGYSRNEAPEARWTRMRGWVAQQLTLETEKA